MSGGHSEGRPWALEASGLSVARGGRQVLEVPSLQVRQNEVLTVIGPNGSGKTTLLLCLALLLKPAAGTVSYGGRPVLSPGQALELRRKVAVVFQESLLLSGTVWDNVTLGLRLRGMRGDEVAASARRWLKRFGMAPLAKRQARTLSGGEAKRTSLARAFALQPEVLFLDEPFIALDTPTRQALLEDFESVLRETGVTTVMVTHDRSEALVLAERVAVLIGGRIRQLGTPADVFSSPVDEEVAGFVDAGNVFQGMVVRQENGLASVEIAGQRVQAVSDLAVGRRASVYLHYEDVILASGAAPSQPTSARNHLRGTVLRAFPHGSQLKVTLDCGFTLAAVITRSSWEELRLQVGQEVEASFKASSVHLIPRL